MNVHLWGVFAALFFFFFEGRLVDGNKPKKQRPYGCISLLGMEGGGIRDSQISASSVQYGLLGLERWGPELARLNNKGIKGIKAWTADSRDRNPWIE
ncbi:hypothetical protein AAFF_G00367790, partial [Aldrovandia affinis]